MIRHQEPWPQERRERLIFLAAEGWTASEVGIQLGLTRNAILGYAHRNGIKFPMTARKAAKIGRGVRRPREPKAPKSTRGRFVPADHPMRRHRERSSRAFTDAEIAVAIAARLAGQSANKSARMIRASAQSLTKNWLKQPELVAAGRALFERAKADAAAKAAIERERADIAAETQRLAQERTNWPILGRMSERHRDIMERRIAGQTLQEVGDAFSVTRERIRQIEVKWRSQGLIVPGARELSARALDKLGWREPRKCGPKAKAVDFWSLANKPNPKPKQRRNLTDAERARRAEHMRGVSRAYWDARA